MHEPVSGITNTRVLGELNTVQGRRLSATCKYIDGLLCDIQHALHSPESKSPFPHYLVNVSPAQVREIEDHIRRLRAQLLKALDWQHLKPEPAELPVSRSVMTDLGFVDIAVEELRPCHMRGCGAVPEDVIGGLNEVVNELRSLVHNISHNIREELGLDQYARANEHEGTGKKG
ncbi:MAG: hypothetical protein ABSD67_13030 [Terracidiphilus sp.]|jgi:hypothetical protein